MADSSFNPKISGSRGQDPVLSKTELDYMRIIEQRNRERVEKLNKISRRNRITASLVGAGVISIYAYSILAVKQERFLDDFEEPAKIQKY